MFEASFSTREIRHSFICKVYAIVFLQLSITSGVILIFILIENVNSFVIRNSWLCIISYCIFLLTYVTLFCCGSIRRKWPWNICLLGIFTISLSLVLGFISALYETNLVLTSIAMTAIVCLLITLFAFQTKIDFSGWHIYPFLIFAIFVAFGLLLSVASFRMQTLFSALMTLLFSMYLVSDTQRIVGGFKHSISPEEYIYGALTLYMDVLMVFLGVLGLTKN